MKYEYNRNHYTINELSDMSGIPPHTIRDRLRRGYTTEESIKQVPTQESIKEFCEASYWKDWIGMTNSYLYEIYWKWCVSNGYTPLSKQGFTRQILSMHPMLKVIPSKVGEKYQRVIRLRS